MVEDLHTSFRTGRGTVRAVDGVSFTVDRGKTLGIVGESGSGKTVLARSIMGLLPLRDVIRSGTVHFAGHDLTAMDPAQLRQVWGAELSMIFQDPMTALNPVKRIGRQITESLRLHLGMDRAEANANAIELLRSVGIPSPEERIRWYPFQLSGGMRQRVMIAIALACAPRLVMADEPTTGLDVTVQAQILDLLAELQRERHMAVILVTHDLGVVASRADEIVVMYAGRIVERAPTHTLFHDTHMPYTQALMDSIPRLADPQRDPAPRHRRAPARPDPPAQGLPVRPPLPLRAGQVPRERPAAAHRRLPGPPLRLLVPLVNGVSTAPSNGASPSAVAQRCRRRRLRTPPTAHRRRRYRRRDRGDGARRRCPPVADDDPVLTVDDLVVEFRSGRQTVHAVSGVSFSVRYGRDARPGGRVRLRQVDHRSRPGPGPASHLRGGHLPGPEPERAVLRRAAAGPDQDPDDLPGPHLLAQSAAPGPGHRGRAPGHLGTGHQGGARRQGARDARSGGDRPRRGRRPAARGVLRRPVPAHQHRPGPDGRPRPAHLRRAGLGPRRLGPGPDPQPAGRPQGASSASPWSSSPTTWPWSRT